MMSERWGLTFAASFHGKNFKPKWQSILLGKSGAEEFQLSYPWQSSRTAFFFAGVANMTLMEEE